MASSLEGRPDLVSAWAADEVAEWFGVAVSELLEPPPTSTGSRASNALTAEQVDEISAQCTAVIQRQDPPLDGKRLVAMPTQNRKDLVKKLAKEGGVKVFARQYKMSNVVEHLIGHHTEFISSVRRENHSGKVSEMKAAAEAKLNDP